MNNQNLGQLIKRRREEYGISQAALARRIGVSPSYLCRLEKGNRHKPNCFLMANICFYLDLDFEEIRKL